MSDLRARRRPPLPPSQYEEFLGEAKCIAAECGLNWEFPVGADGIADARDAWDIRDLVGTKEESGAYLRRFDVDTKMQARAGWSVASMALGTCLDSDAQAFIKAAVVHLAKRKLAARKIRHFALNCRTILSLYSCKPWELSSDDLGRLLELKIDIEFRRSVQQLVRMMNERLLSLCVPISVKEQQQPEGELLEGLLARSESHKLPDEASLYELARIVFQEKPRSHADLLRFAIVRILYMTGLRIEEVRWLPRDCLIWSEHTDPITGQEAGRVGGVSRTLRLRYFGEKRAEGAPDILVEDTQVVPERFQHHIVDAVRCVDEATSSLRAVLHQQGRDAINFPGSRHERFFTSDGKEVGYSDLLFLTIKGLQGNLPDMTAKDSKITLISIASVYDFVGVNTTVLHKSAFEKYRSLTSPPQGSVRPHSLRHLLTTELFRHRVADTVITAHFGRAAVAQSYEYDHRSLAEKLEFIRLPDGAEGFFEKRSVSESVAKMVIAGLVPESHVSRSFATIQEEHGDDAAFAYLAANADGFHVTPYGFCVNSFAMNPCPKHLKCFSGCSQYAPSGLEIHRVNLEKLRVRIEAQKDKAEARSVGSVGRRNQVAHARELLEGINAALRGTPGLPVFPEGVDHSAPPKDLFA